MAQTLVRVLVHLVFSTKDRANLIVPAIESELHTYLAGIANRMDSPCLAVNGTANHVHLLLSQSKNGALADLVAEVKKGSSKWVKTKGPAFRNFHWQDGYAAFSVSQSNAATVKRYVAEQKEHHRKRSFQEELVEFLQKHQVEYDGRYIWT